MEQVRDLPETGARKYTARERLQNWLHYHIWWVVAVLFLVVVFSSMIMTRVEEKKQRCDYCVAYVATRELPGECLESLKTRIAALGTDVDGDGAVTVKINQYIPGDTSTVSENASYGRAAEAAILTDISEMESYIFLVEYPEDFQLDFQLMAHLDGSPSTEDDFGVWDKVYAWTDCPVLAGLDLGTCDDGTGKQVACQSLMETLYVGRRCFIQPDAKANSPENRALWAALTEGATPVQKPAE